MARGSGGEGARTKLACKAGGGVSDADVHVSSLLSFYISPTFSALQSPSALDYKHFFNSSSSSGNLPCHVRWIHLPREYMTFSLEWHTLGTPKKLAAFYCLCS